MPSTLIRTWVEETQATERVKKIVIDHLGRADKVVEGASFIDDLGADSFDRRTGDGFRRNSALKFRTMLPTPSSRLRRCQVHRKAQA